MFEEWNNPDYLRGIVSSILQEAKNCGATSAEVDLGFNKGFSVSARMGDVESVEYNQDKAIDITVYFDQRMGTASISDVRPEAIHAAVQAACNIAKYTDQDECSGLAEKELLAFDYPPVDLFYPWDISVEQAIALALECESIALGQNKYVTKSENTAVTTTNAWTAYGNSHGFIGLFPMTRHEISCVLIAQKGQDMQRDYDYTVACDANLLESVQEVANNAVKRTVQRLGAQRLSTRRVPVIFSAEIARGLLGHFVSAISGGSLYRKSSFLLDHLGQPVFPKHVTIDEHPFLPKSLGSAPFDDDGVLTQHNVFIKDGVLNSYALGTYSARKLKMKTTGNAGGVHNLKINTGNKQLPDLLKTMGTGLLITELMGQGINLVTGDYSRGAAGYWVEQGEIQYPVEEITVAGKLQDMYANLVEVGADVDMRGNIQTGSILLESMTVAGG